MLREIVTPQSRQHIVHIPEEYINTKVEILVLPFANVESNKSVRDTENIFAETAGILRGQGIDPVAWQKEIRSEWDR